MVFMILANILFLFRKIKVACQVVLDLVHTPKLAHSLLYSTNHAKENVKKDHFYFPMNPNTYNAAADNCSKSLMKKVLDNCVSLCYNGNITIRNQPNAAQPVNISPFTSQQEKNTIKD